MNKVHGFSTDRSVSRVVFLEAIGAGVNYFDHSRSRPGNGKSKKNMARPTENSNPKTVVGTKPLRPISVSLADATARSHEGSLGTCPDRVDISACTMQLPRPAAAEALSIQQVLGDVVPRRRAAAPAGKTRLLGLTAVGDTAALHQMIDARAFDSAQVVYNMLNPYLGGLRCCRLPEKCQWRVAARVLARNN